MIQINDKLNIYFPLKLKPRVQQLEGFEFVKESINNGKKYMLLNLPTGVGKSYFTIMFANWYKNYVNENAKIDILTNSKILQQQYINDNPFIKNLKGRGNYDCDPHNTNCDTGMEICKHSGPACNSNCPYKSAKNEWMNSDFSMTNFHMFSAFAIYQRENSFLKRESTMLIIDEATDFEQIYCDYISISLNSKQLKRFGFDFEKIEEYDDIISGIKTIDDFYYFLKNDLLPSIQENFDEYSNQIKSIKPFERKRKEDISKILSYCSSTIPKYSFFINQYIKDKENWVLEYDKKEKQKYKKFLNVSPVWGHKFLNKSIWDKYDHVLFLSGTILNREVFSFINGIEYEKSAYIDIPSPFPLNRRPIFYLKVGKMSMNEKEETFQKQLVYIEKIISRNKNNKGIIHCGTYEFAEWLKTHYKNDRLLYHTPTDRDEVLEKHIVATEPTILVSPSMITGVDLKENLSRFQIILKIPYPYLGSKKITQRNKTYQKWYLYKTCSDLMQCLGRSVRSEEDWAESYILDSCFSDILVKDEFLPRWFTDSVKILKI